MRIINRNANRSRYSSGCTLFVFEFKHHDEFEEYLESLRYCAQQLPGKRAGEVLLDTASKLEQRCDDHYAHDDTELSASLFPDEMARFMMSMTGVMWMYEDFSKELEDFAAELGSLIENVEDQLLTV